MTGVLTRRECPVNTGAQATPCVTLEAETGATQLQAEESQGVMTTPRSWEEAEKDSTRVSEGAWPG